MQLEASESTSRYSEPTEKFFDSHGAVHVLSLHSPGHLPTAQQTQSLRAEHKRPWQTIKAHLPATSEVTINSFGSGVSRTLMHAERCILNKHSKDHKKAFFSVGLIFEECLVLQ